MKVYVHIMPRKGVLDPQGKAVANALNGLGFNSVEGARQGKLIELELADDVSDVEANVKEMCKKLLVNEVVEDFEIKVV